MAIPEIRNDVFTPTLTVIGLLNKSPIDMVIDEINMRTKNARPVFSASTVS